MAEARTITALGAASARCRPTCAGATTAARNWANRKIKDKFLPLVANAPCLTYFEVFKRGSPRERLRTLGNAIAMRGLF